MLDTDVRRPEVPRQSLGGVAKSQFPRKAVIFKSGNRVRTRSIFVYPLEHSGVVPPEARDWSILNMGLLRLY